MTSARCIAEIAVLIDGAITDPVAAIAPLQLAASTWLDNAGRRYQLFWATRILLTEIRDAVDPTPETLLRWQAIAADLNAQYNPPRNPYLDPADARADAIALGLYTEETAPTVEQFGVALDRLCTRMEQWLGRRIAIATYTRNLSSDRFGMIRLPVPHVQAVESVVMLMSQTQSKAIDLTDVIELWDGDRRIETGFPSTKFEVVFTAGLDPVPDAVLDSLFDLLLYAISRDATLRSLDLSQLDRPDREVEQVSLPGGLSKKFAVPTPSEDGSEASVIDRILDSIAPYRRQGHLIC